MVKTKVFLDANILWSACYRENTPLLRLWRIDDVEICTSPYVVDEVLKNLIPGRQRATFQDLIHKVEVYPVVNPPMPLFRMSYGLPEDDQPVLWAAIDVKARYLVTGDLKHFGPIMDTIIEGVEIIRARRLLELFPIKRTTVADPDA